MINYFKTLEDVLRAIKNDKIQMLDLRFTDVSAQWQQLLVPTSTFDLKTLQTGLRFNGSSAHRFNGIQKNDMLITPDPSAAFLNPFAEMPSLVVICNIRDPAAGHNYTRDPRWIAQKAEAPAH